MSQHGTSSSLQHDMSSVQHDPKKYETHQKDIKPQICPRDTIGRKRMVAFLPSIILHGPSCVFQFPVKILLSRSIRWGMAIGLVRMGGHSILQGYATRERKSLAGLAWS